MQKFNVTFPKLKVAHLDYINVENEKNELATEPISNLTVGKCNGNEIAKEVMQRIQNYVHKEGDTRATRFARERNKLAIRDRNSDFLELSNYCTPRSIYTRFYF